MRPLKQLKEISEINLEQKKIELELTLIKSEFEDSISNLNENAKGYVDEVNNDVKDFLVNKVAIPAGVIGLSWLLIKSMKNRKTVRIEKEQINEIKKTVSKNSIPVPNKTYTKTSSTPPKHQTPATPVVQKIVKTERPKDNRFKKWLPIAIQLAKTGYTYYQNSYANQSSTGYNTVIRDNFLNPNPPQQEGNPYDRIPEIIEE